jgi:hypothetical protein
LEQARKASRFAAFGPDILVSIVSPQCPPEDLWSLPEERITVG